MLREDLSVDPVSCDVTKCSVMSQAEQAAAVFKVSKQLQSLQGTKRDKVSPDWAGGTQAGASVRIRRRNWTNEHGCMDTGLVVWSTSTHLLAY